MKKYVAFGEMMADRWRGRALLAFRGEAMLASITVSHGHRDACCAWEYLKRCNRLS